MLTMLLGASARAQVAGSLVLQNDDEFRGYSLSERRPVAILNLSYEDASGFYANASPAGSVSGNGDPMLLGLYENVGYARRLNRVVSIDGGLVRSDYFERYGKRSSEGYTEAYIGFFSHGLSSHVYVSPDYFGRDVSTLYGEIEYALEPIRQIRLSAHIGLLGYLSAPAGLPPSSPRYDWRITVSRQFGAFDLHAAISGGGPSDDGDDNRRPRAKMALVIGAGWTF